jgi:hypothetical protein
MPPSGIGQKSKPQFLDKVANYLKALSLFVLMFAIAGHDHLIRPGIKLNGAVFGFDVCEESAIFSESSQRLLGPPDRDCHYLDVGNK